MNKSQLRLFIQAVRQNQMNIWSTLPFFGAITFPLWVYIDSLTLVRSPHFSLFILIEALGYIAAFLFLYWQRPRWSVVSGTQVSFLKLWCLSGASGAVLGVVVGTLNLLLGYDQVGRAVSRTIEVALISSTWLPINAVLAVGVFQMSSPISELNRKVLLHARGLQLSSALKDSIKRQVDQELVGDFVARAMQVRVKFDELVANTIELRSASHLVRDFALRDVRETSSTLWSTYELVERDRLNRKHGFFFSIKKLAGLGERTPVAWPLNTWLLGSILIPLWMRAQWNIGGLLVVMAVFVSFVMWQIATSRVWEWFPRWRPIALRFRFFSSDIVFVGVAKFSIEKFLPTIQPPLFWWPVLFSCVFFLMGLTVLSKNALTSVDEMVLKSTSALEKEETISREVRDQIAISSHDLAGYFHSELQSRLLAVSGFLDAASAESDDARRNYLVEEAVRAMEGAPVFHEKKLETAREVVEDRCALWASLIEIKINGDLDSLEGWLSLHEIKRVVEENIVNAVRHGTARHLEISFQRNDNGCLRILFVDDGVGIDEGSTSQGLGSLFLDSFSHSWSRTPNVDSRGCVLEILINPRPHSDG